MSLRDMITFNRAVSGIQNSVKNIASIRAARQQLEEKKKIDDLTIQQKKLDIEKQSMQNQWTKMDIAQHNAYIKEQQKILDAENTAWEGKLDVTQIGERTKLGQLSQEAQQSAPGAARMQGLFSFAQNNKNLPRTAALVKGDKQSSAIPREDLVLGKLDAGLVINGTEVPFEDKEQAEKYASRSLGYGWQKKYPKVGEFINEKFKTPDLDLTKGARIGAEAGFDKAALKVGEIRDIAGKGKWKFTGGNTWEKVK